MSSIRRTQRQEWQEHLQALEFFNDITILADDQHDIENEYERAIGEISVIGNKSGIVVVLFTVPAKPDGKDQFGPVIQCYHVAHVVENVPVNRGDHGTGKTREEVVEKIIEATHAVFQPTTARSPFMLDDQGIEPVQDMPSENVSFLCASNFEANLTAVATPVLTNAGGDVTMTCATPGAAIFYTTDGTRPTPFSTLYVDTITLSGTIKARAFLAGHFHSELATLTI